MSHNNTTVIPPLPESGAVTIDQVMAHIQIKKTALYDWMAKGKYDFPRPRKLGSRSVWLAEEIHEWLKAQPVAKIGNQGGIRHTCK